jgi:hypothetical protein
LPSIETVIFTHVAKLIKGLLAFHNAGCYALRVDLHPDQRVTPPLAQAIDQGFHFNKRRNTFGLANPKV